jgi:hypothetical protein
VAPFVVENAEEPFVMLLGGWGRNVEANQMTPDSHAWGNACFEVEIRGISLDKQAQQIINWQ